MQDEEEDVVKTRNFLTLSYTPVADAENKEILSWTLELYWIVFYWQVKEESLYSTDSLSLSLSLSVSLNDLWPVRISSLHLFCLFFFNLLHLALPVAMVSSVLVESSVLQEETRQQGQVSFTEDGTAFTQIYTHIHIEKSDSFTKHPCTSYDHLL